jgi:periplasmic protein TonB
LIEDAPVYKGCEGLSKEENKKCFDKKMTRFVVRNFDANLAQELGLHSGKHKMYSQFIIDKTGAVIDIIIKAPHPKLEKELDRIIRKLPQFTPGKQRKKPVKVKYTLPISFQVE